MFKEMDPPQTQTHLFISLCFTSYYTLQLNRSINVIDKLIILLNTEFIMIIFE